MPSVPQCKSKFVCTIGPATESVEQLRELILNGMNMARLNFSHCTHEFARTIIERVRMLSKELDKPIGILIDGNGPKLRTGLLPNGQTAMMVKKGDAVIFYEKQEKPGVEEVVQVSALGLAGNVLSGDKIFIDDGLLSLTVLKSNLEWVECQVDNSGWLRNSKGINLVTGQSVAEGFGGYVSSPFLGISNSHKSHSSQQHQFLKKSDRLDLAIAVELDVEWVTVSCIRHAQDIAEINAFLEAEARARGKENRPGRVRLLAKIENKAGVENFESILEASDGVIVDRGYLGVEIDLARLAALQRSLVERCLCAGKPILVANHVLERMCELPRPGRSEAADIAATVELGIDGFILSAETAVGAYPIEALQWLRRICTESEHLLHANNFVAGRIIRQLQSHSKTICNSHGNQYDRVPISESIASSTVKCAREVNAAAVIVSTEGGGMARLIAKYRPSVAVVAGCADDTVAGQMCISYGIIPLVVKAEERGEGHSANGPANGSLSPAVVIQGALKYSHELGLLQAGDKAVVASGQVDGFLDGSSTFMQVLTLASNAHNCPVSEEAMGELDDDVED